MLLRNESFFKRIFILSSNFFHSTKFVEAMLFFLLAMLSCLLAPWTLAVLWYFLFPGHTEAQPPTPPPTQDPRSQVPGLVRMIPDPIRMEFFLVVTLSG